VKLYSWGRAPNPRRVLIYLAEKGIEIPIVEAGEGARLSDDYLAHYEARTVPMLELDDGTQIGEAMAICRYLEDEFPNPPLMGVDRRDRAIVEMWERRAEAEAFPGASEVFRNSHPSFAGRGLPGFTEPVDQIPALVERGKQRLGRFFRRIDAQLATNPFIAGERFTVADITALCAADFARKIGKIEIPDACRHAKRWHAEVSARPSTKM
jgi:glutathione S-transferase